MTFRRLRDADLISFATDMERLAARKMNEIDRAKREPKGRVDQIGELLA